MKHAYLLLVHNNPEQLKRLIGLLDDERNDIFVHVDEDTDFPIADFSECAKYSTLTFIDRISIKWADYSIVKAELNLLRAATEKGEYKYYHLLSGADLPLKNQDEIHGFFDGQDSEFVGVVPIECPYNIRHVRFYYPLLKFKRFRKHKWLKVLNEGWVKVQKCLFINRIRKLDDYHFYDGWQWFSITHAFAKYALDNEKFIDKTFVSTKAPDELVFQTLAMNSPFKERLYDQESLTNGSQRYIDWKRGKPYTFKAEDFDELINSNCMFARKFDDKTDGEIIRKIIEKISE